jgi:hypothetical protein
LTVVDFFVHNGLRRQGYGQGLFEFMLDMEGAMPAQLAYYRPSRPLLSFLNQNYGLCKYLE